MATSVITQVNSDTYGGLSGYRRPTNGNPTQLGRNLPAFRGTTNTPGQAIRVPAIKSSANRNNRGTNVCIPYPRVTPIDYAHEMGRCDQGDIIFCSRASYGDPGFAHGRLSRLVGLDFINKQLGPLNWAKRNVQGPADPNGGGNMHSRILVYNKAREPTLDDSGKSLNTWMPPGNITDDWRKVSFLREWALDGVVLSNDEKAAYYSSGDRDGQLFKIGIPGPCQVNNGYEDRNGNGMYSRPPSGVNVHQTGTFAQRHQMGNLHFYPLQMFDRGVRPLDNLYVCLVATVHKNPTYAETDEEKKTWLEAYRAAGFVKPGTDDTVANAPHEFYSFQFKLRSSSTLYDLKKEDDLLDMDPNDPTAIESILKKRRRAPDSGTKAERAGFGYGSFEVNIDELETDSCAIVGAWRLGKVLDTKSGVQPHFPGGPGENGCRLTVNVNIEWLDRRRLAKTFWPRTCQTECMDAFQRYEEFRLCGDDEFGDVPSETRPRDRREYNNERLFQWPTYYNEEAKREKSYGSAVKNPNIPYNPALYDPDPSKNRIGRSKQWYTKQWIRKKNEKPQIGQAPDEMPSMQMEPAVEDAPASPAKKQRIEAAPEPTLIEAIEAEKQAPKQTAPVEAPVEEAIEAPPEKVAEAPIEKVAETPVAMDVEPSTSEAQPQPKPVGAPAKKRVIVKKKKSAAAIAAAAAVEAIAPEDDDSLKPLGDVLSPAPVEAAPTYRRKSRHTPSPSPSQASESSLSVASVGQVATTGFRRRGANAPSPSPDRMSESSLSIGSESHAEAPIQTGFRRRASSAPSPTPEKRAVAAPAKIEESLEPVAEATASPAPKRKDRSKTVAAAASVFSSIFGDDDGASLQPLNPDDATEDLTSTRPLGEGSSKSFRRRKDR